MRTALELNNDEACDFFLKEDSYCNFDLPEYFTFQSLLDNLHQELNGKNLKECRSAHPRDFEGVNYLLINNKDGRYAWRPMQLPHPAIYVSLVHSITEENQWQDIKNRFEEFKANPRIECHSYPVLSESEKSDNEEQISKWYQDVEQRSLILALEYDHILHTDITDCYGSIYTHSLAWALHTKPVAKEKENRGNGNLVGNMIDWNLQDMKNGQTNGIPQGSKLMDFIAEMVLGYADLLLSERLNAKGVENYKIIRYRDDYRIFTNSTQDASLIAKELSEVLSSLNLKLNPEKTQVSDDIITSSIKPDKLYWINYKRKTENKQKWLLQLYTLGKKFPNSGTLLRELSKFLDWIEQSDKDVYEPQVLISILANIAYKNPRFYGLTTAAISFLIPHIEDIEEKKTIINKIRNRFSNIPNTTYLNVWLQRLTLKIDRELDYEGALCQKVVNRDQTIWFSDWLNPKYKGLIEDEPIVDDAKIESIGIEFSESERKSLGTTENIPS